MDTGKIQAGNVHGRFEGSPERELPDNWVLEKGPDALGTWYRDLQRRSQRETDRETDRDRRKQRQGETGRKTQRKEMEKHIEKGREKKGDRQTESGERQNSERKGRPRKKKAEQKQTCRKERWLSGRRERQEHGACTPGLSTWEGLKYLLT